MIYFVPLGQDGVCSAVEDDGGSAVVGVAIGTEEAVPTEALSWHHKNTHNEVPGGADGEGGGERTGEVGVEKRGMGGRCRIGGRGWGRGGGVSSQPPLAKGRAGDTPVGARG